MTTIVQTGDKVLRETAKEVPWADIKTAKIKGILSKMTSTISNAKDGVALAGASNRPTAPNFYRFERIHGK